MIAALLANAAEEGRNVILAMLVVGLVLLAYPVLGELVERRGRRRHGR